MGEISPALREALADRYDLVRVVGQGGMATVYLAQDRKHDREVAVKVLRPELAASIGTQRFLKEIAIAARLSHPHIVALHDSGESRGFLYYVMPYVDGESLRALLRRTTTMPLGVTFGIARQVADALGYAHRAGVLHRDIKPENILLSEGHAFVVDFGIAKAVSTAGGPSATRTGFALGTPGYMSPEQAAGVRHIDERTDVYGLACVVYEMLVGEPPGLWVTETAARVGRFVDAEPLHRERLDALSGRVEQVLARALALRPTDRFPTVASFADALVQSSQRGPVRYTDRDIRDIVGRAARLEAEHPTLDGLFSIGGVERLAAEVGVPPEHVRRALEDLDRQPRRDAPVRVPQPMPAGPSSTTVSLEKVAEHELSVSAFGEIVEEIQTVLGRGRVSVWENTLEWSSAVRGGAPGRQVRITVAPRDGRTRIQMQEHVEQVAGQLFGGVTGAFFGGLFGLTVGGGVGAGEPSVVAAFGLLGTVGGAFLVARSLGVSAVMRRERELEALAARLVRHVEGAAVGWRNDLALPTTSTAERNR